MTTKGPKEPKPPKPPKDPNAPKKPRAKKAIPLQGKETVAEAKEAILDVIDETTGHPLKVYDPKMSARLQVRYAIRFFYDIQQLRIQTAGRTSSKDRDDNEAQVDLDEKSQLFLTLTSDTVNALERAILREIKRLLKPMPIFSQFLSDVRGIGPTLAALLISEIDIHKAPTVSALWAYCFPPGTPILTSEGVVPIDLLEEGNLLVDSSGKWTTVQKTMVRQYDPVDGGLVTLKADRLLPFQCEPKCLRNP